MANPRPTRERMVWTVTSLREHPINHVSRDYIQVDESTSPVIDNEKHRTVKGYMWCKRAVEDNLVAFLYDMGSRSHETARRILRGYRGTIQADGYGAYDQFENDPHFQVIGC